MLLDYVANYPNDGILYCASNMNLTVHSDAGFHNKTKGHSCAGAHMFLAEDESIPRWNLTILTIAQIIKFFMASAAEAELGAHFIITKKVLPIFQTLIEMGWPQPAHPSKQTILWQLEWLIKP